MSTYTTSQEDWDKMNQSLCRIFDIDYQSVTLSEEERTFERVKRCIGFNYKHTEETKILLSHIASNPTDAMRLKMSLAKKGKTPHNKGIPTTQSHRDKTSKGCKQTYADGRVTWNKGLKGFRTGPRRPFTPEEKLRISEATKKGMAAKKAAKSVLTAN